MKVSVIMPTYNRLSLLRRAVSSFLEQDYINSELIILNNGSNDGTKEYLATIKNARVIVYNRPLNKVKGVLNELWELCDGDLVCQLHDDDQMTKNSISLRVNAFKNDKFLEVCYAGWENKKLDGKSLGVYKGQSSNPCRIIQNEYINFTTMMWKNELKKKFMIDEDFEFNSDTLFKIRCGMECTMTCIEESVMNYTIHNGQETIRNRASGSHVIESKLVREKIKQIYGGLFL
jgi:glycosyltransferase involved in cell wall biosynthesis